MEIIDKIIKSKHQPKQTNVTWVDLSGKTPIEKHYINGQWIEVGDSSGGTSDYTNLENKPSINGVELDGDLTNEDLHIGAVEIEYQDLVALRDNGELVPGTQYRITDYQCTTTQDNTQSAGHAFDIIVRADDESHLNENAFAAHHEGNEYFANCKLEAWKLKYCLDNDTNRFGWATDGSGGFWVEYEDKDTIRLMRTAIIEGKDTVWQYGEGKDLYYSAPDPVAGDYIYDDDTLSNVVNIITATGTIQGVEGTGVVYWMKDEFGNEAPYDFKNIMFKRFEITAVKNGNNDIEYLNHPLVGTWGLPNEKVSVDSEASEWFYTFSSVDNNEVLDASLAFEYNFVSGPGFGAGQNKIEGVFKGQMKLGNNVFINSAGVLLCNGNRIGCGCFENTFGNFCMSNTFGTNCYRNTFGNSFQFNTFGNNCYYNTFGNDCQYNSFGNNCYYNMFGNYCYYNMFGNNCVCNSFGNSCSRNTFGNDCQYNSFGNNCVCNSFGNSCSRNTFGNDCQYNSFGNNCYYNMFGNYCYYNMFGNNCQNNSFGNYCQSITVFDGVQNCSVTGGSKSALVKNAQILNGTAGASSANKLTIAFAANKAYTQVAAKDTNGDLQIFNPADLV